MSITIPKFDPVVKKIKVVDYFDQRIDVPADVNWVAINPNGHMMGFDRKPVQLSFGWAVEHLLEYSELLGYVEYDGDWKDSLIECTDNIVVSDKCNEINELGANIFLTYEDSRYPTLAIRTDDYIVGYDLNLSNGELSRVCICHAYSSSECVCGAWYET